MLRLPLSLACTLTTQVGGQGFGSSVLQQLLSKLRARLVLNVLRQLAAWRLDLDALLLHAREWAGCYLLCCHSYVT